jgi:hypothetical protein
MQTPNNYTHANPLSSFYKNKALCLTMLRLI